MKLVISDIENLNLKKCITLNNNINYCKGCFNCWVNTPMKCIFNDKCKNTSKYFLDTKSPYPVTEVRAVGLFLFKTCSEET